MASDDDVDDDDDGDDGGGNDVDDHHDHDHALPSGVCLAFLPSCPLGCSRWRPMMNILFYQEGRRLGFVGTIGCMMIVPLNCCIR